MTIDILQLIEWLGPDGARAGLRESRLSLQDLIDLARAKGLPLSPKPTREEISNELAFAGVKKIDKELDVLLTMTQSELLDYFSQKRPTISELSHLLRELGIEAKSVDKKRLLRFAAREISDTGLYQRVARGGNGT